PVFAQRDLEKLASGNGLELVDVNFGIQTDLGEDIVVVQNRLLDCRFLLLLLRCRAGGRRRRGSWGRGAGRRGGSADWWRTWRGSWVGGVASGEAANEHDARECGGAC